MSLSFSTSLNREKITFFHRIAEWCDSRGQLHVSSHTESCALNVHKKWTCLPHHVLFSTSGKSLLSFRIVLTRLWSFPDINICYLAKVRTVTIFQFIQRNIWLLMILFTALSYTPVCKIPDQLLQAFHNNLLLFALSWESVRFGAPNSLCFSVKSNSKSLCIWSSIVWGIFSSNDGCLTRRHNRR